MRATASLEHFEPMPEENHTEHPGEATTPSPGQQTGEEQQPLPPEAQGEVNGGPLGCCLGTTIGLVLSLAVAVIGRIYANPLLPVFHSALLVLILLRIAMAITAIAGAVILGYFGWTIGRKLYREYEPPVIRYRTHKRGKIKATRKL
jgi:phosphotransferase system  glucose/maltose/N-acetylglucosamine-specific IIC component